MAKQTTRRATVAWEEHWQTWSINFGFYGVSYGDERDQTTWSSEWHRTEAEARAVAKRAADITAGVRQHGRPDARGNRRYRLRITVLGDGRLSVREYDRGQFEFVV